ncbi:hypothetical protein W97_02677 [Coniosporium apollinis CBS 100218]|uniref:Nudix hydrolase domain-containing protein n=1 Tax=Coniosporium apollinis (strain CBS 100218) TaxID=1168221 RepID=R7YNQ7_CONA1|nr:uncharacterized protein W97_02677 [Coniosporium apollinis CBS 100218]EON63449.1 hypothetical protein W97_02677 [Coniosporium apollinis CBS 100218]
MQLSPKTYKPSRSSRDTAPAPSPSSSRPVLANYASHHLTIGCGVAIFHVASARVVLCFHSRDRYWFLPKGRRDANEESGPAAEREGYEESGYRNRLLPLPIRHRQPRAHAPAAAHSPFSTEPVWTQLIPQSATTQYILFWYIAETLPPNLQPPTTGNIPASSTTPSTDTSPPPQSPTASSTASTPQKPPYTPPSTYPPTLSLRTRIAQEPPGYEPPKEEGTGVDAEEALYLSSLVPVAEAREKLRGSIMADVVAKGWEAVLARLGMEEAEAEAGG